MGLGRWFKRKRDVIRVRCTPLCRGSKHGLPGTLVVSLTSFPARFATLDLTLRALLAQSVQPDLVVLWVAPEDRKLLPPSVTRLEEHNFIIREHRDIGPFKKIVPSLKAYPGAFIVTADDDVYYPTGWLGRFVAAYRSPDEIICQRAHRIRFRAGELLPYTQWEINIPEEVTGPTVFPTGHGGVLYPPGALPPQTTDEATFLRLCPRADDVWLYWMAARARRSFRHVTAPRRFRQWPGSQTVALQHSNVKQGGNDKQIAAMLAAFGLPDILVEALACQTPEARG